MASLIQQTARCIFFRNLNVLRTVVAKQRSFHAISCVPALPKFNIQHQIQFQSAPYSTKDIKEIESRVMKVIGDYDKVSAAKLSLDSHFIQDLGLDSLDHVELVMAMEDEFGFEIPDNDAERLTRPSDIIKYISEKEDASA